MSKKLLLIFGSLMLSSACSSAPTTDLSYATIHGAAQDQMQALRIDLNALREKVAKDYDSRGRGSVALDLRRLNRHFDRIEAALGDSEEIRPDRLSQTLMYLSIRTCPLGSGRCPLAMIARGLATAEVDPIPEIDLIDQRMLRLIRDYRGWSGAGTELYLLDDRPNSASTDLPLSGFEAKYEPGRWNDEQRFGRIQVNTNCYAYSLNVQRHPQTGQYFPLKDGGFALQPGDFVGRTLSDAALGDPKAQEIIEAVKQDAAATGGIFQAVGASDKTPPGTYKVALVIAPDAPYQDYHWYRQNPDGTWSHKPGSLTVRLEDAAGQTILDPRTANRMADKFNYRVFVGFYAVKARSL